MPRERVKVKVAPFGQKGDYQALLDEKCYEALDAKSAYWSTYNDYMDTMAEAGYFGMVTGETLGIYLLKKCEAAKNAASFPYWASHILVIGRREKNLDFAEGDRGTLKKLKWACSKLYGESNMQAEEWGTHELELMASRVAPDPDKDLKEWNIFVQAVTMENTMVRPGDFCGRKAGVKVKHVSFLPPSTKLPYGGIDITIDNSKRQRLAGKRDIEHAMGVGTGNSVCPVALLEEYFERHNLSRYPEAPLFAKLRGNGSRCPTVMLLSQYNSGLAALFKGAGIKKGTARGSRPGRRTELGAAGAQDSVVTTLGRWSQFSSSRPYTRQSVPLLHHIIKALGIE